MNNNENNLNQENNQVQLESRKNKISKGKKIIVIVLILVLVLILAAIAFLYFNNKDATEQKEEEKSNVVYEWANVENGNSDSVINIYKSENDSYYIAEEYSNDDIKYLENEYEKTDEYICHSSDCYIISSDYNSSKEYYMIWDNNYYLVLISDKKQLLINAEDINMFEAIDDYNDNLIGLSLRNSTEKSAFYNIELNKIIIDYLYERYTEGFYNENSSITDKTIPAIKDYDINDSGDGVFEMMTIDFIDITTGEIKTSLNTAYDYLQIIEENNNKYILASHYDAYMTDYIYTLDLKQIGNESIFTFDLTKEGNLIYGKTNVDYMQTQPPYEIYIYNANGDLLSTSKNEYNSIEFVSDDASVVLDENNIITVIDNEENILVQFDEFTSNLGILDFGESFNVHLEDSEYLPTKEDGSKYPAGLYIEYENNNFEYGEHGHSIIYYYSPTTGESGKIIN